jgi:hypothetical protein
VLTGHCSHCHKVWTLETAQGVCQWCGKFATCQTNRAQALRGIKSRRNGSKRQAEANGNGYDQLEGEWLTYYQVASQFSHKAKLEDRQDLLHDIMLTLANVARNNGHRPFTEAGMCRIASIAVVHYWRTQYRLINGLDCGSCSKAQRQKCRSEDLYSECPKAIKLEYLDKPITDDEGNLTELGELIADDHSLDLDEWLDSKTFLAGCPQRLIGIAHKRIERIPLTKYEQLYLCRYWKKHQERLLD